MKHVARLLELSGESSAQAANDAQTVLAMETALANAAMDIVVRRDPKNLNNKMSLEQSAGADALLQLETLLCRDARTGVAAIPGTGARFLSRHGEADRFRAGRPLARLSALLHSAFPGIFA